MAITRREALKHGISYGSGVINHGNDSIAYDKDLRSFPQNNAWAEMQEALEGVEFADTESEEASEEINESVQAAIDKTKAFMKTCGHLCLSELFLSTRPVLDALEENTFPAPIDLDNMEAKYNEIVAYLSVA